jgi:hypothetical protein
VASLRSSRAQRSIRSATAAASAASVRRLAARTMKQASESHKASDADDRRPWGVTMDESWALSRDMVASAPSAGTIPGFRDWTNWRDLGTLGGVASDALPEKTTGGCQGFPATPFKPFRVRGSSWRGHAPLFISVIRQKRRLCFSHHAASTPRMKQALPSPQRTRAAGHTLRSGSPWRWVTQITKMR